jgi:hypothetical protein
MNEVRRLRGGVVVFIFIFIFYRRVTKPRKWESFYIVVTFIAYSVTQNVAIYILETSARQIELA